MKRKGYAAILAALMLAAVGCNSGTSSGSTASQGGSTPQNSTGGVLAVTAPHPVRLRMTAPSMSPERFPL